MMRNPYGQLKEIEKKMKALEGEVSVLYFTDGSVLEMTERENGNLLDDVMHDRPNKHVDLILDKLDRGIMDDEGVCHLLRTFTMDIEELWRDHQ